MSDFKEQSAASSVAPEGAAGGSKEPEKDSSKAESEISIRGDEKIPSSAAEDSAGAKPETESEEAPSPTKSKKVSFNPTPHVISESEKEWEDSSATTSSKSSESPPGASTSCAPSDKLAALHFQSPEFLESVSLSDTPSDETSGDSEGSDSSDGQPDVSLDDLARIKTHSLCQGKKELGESEIEILQRSFNFVKSKLEASLKRTLTRCNKEMSTFDDMTKDLVGSFRELFVILCIRSSDEERTFKQFTEKGSKLVSKITEKSLAAFNRQYSQKTPTIVENAIRSWFSTAKLAVLKEVSDMETAASADGQQSKTDSASASASELGASASK